MGKKAKYSKSHKRGFFDYVGIYLKGACMGAADVVPGVSGGTIALILRVYVELVDSLKAIFSKDLLHIFRRGGFRQYWQAIHGGFLLALLAGIVSAILLLAGVILHLVEHYPVRVWSFFFGLVVASIFLVLWRISKWRWFTPIFVILGIVAGYFIVTSPGLRHDTPGHLGEFYPAAAGEIHPGNDGCAYAQFWRAPAVCPGGIGGVALLCAPALMAAAPLPQSHIGAIGRAYGGHYPENLAVARIERNG